MTAAAAFFHLSAAPRRRDAEAARAAILDAAKMQLAGMS